MKDPTTKKNFQNLAEYFASQNQLLGFNFFELNFTGSVTGQLFNHGLSVVPNDVLVTRLTGGGAVTFNFGLFTTTQMSISTTAACRVRFFIGTYWNYITSAGQKNTDSQTYYSSVSSEKGITPPTLQVLGSQTGVITLKGQPNAGTYEFDMPTTAGTNGYFLTSGGGLGTAMYWSNPLTSLGVPVVTVLTNGTGTFAVTSKTRMLIIRMVGCGGGGGAANVAANAAAGGGGGAGAYVENIISYPALLGSYSYTVSSTGGTAGTTSSAGGDGSDTVFGTVTAHGGKGGNAHTSGTNVVIFSTTRAAGGTVLGTPTWGTSGAAGWCGIVGSATEAQGGQGGDALPFGAGGIGGHNSAAGTTASGYGAGGGGGSTISGGGSHSGGAGAPGIIVILAF